MAVAASGFGSANRHSPLQRRFPESSRGSAPTNAEPGSETRSALAIYLRAVQRCQRRPGSGRDRAALVEGNLDLVVSVAGRYRGLGMPLEDLIQEGNPAACG